MKRSNKFLTTLGVIAGVAVIGLGATTFAHSDYHKRHGDHEAYERNGSDDHHRGKSRKKKFAMHMMEKYDANKDQTLTLDEIIAGRTSQFQSHDKNNDGLLEIAEYETLWAEAMRERMVDRFQSHDNDGDGKISPEDFSKKIPYMMHRMDRNDDGKVDFSDMK